jgi:hypothetical protein
MLTKFWDLGRIEVQVIIKLGSKKSLDWKGLGFRVRFRFREPNPIISLFSK